MSGLLRLENVQKHFYRGFWRRETVRALDGVSLTIEAGTTLAVVGESGSGKTTLCRVALGLTVPTGGRVLFEGQDLGRLNGNLRPVRRRMQAVFQDVEGALNPRLTVADLLTEPLKVHGLARGLHGDWIEDLLDTVNLSADLLCRRPHEISGGQRQRVAIARAMALKPRLVVADEPIASLDRSAQAEMLCLLEEIQRQSAVAYLIVSHDLKSVRYIAHDLAVMFLGVVVEQGGASEVFHAPAHPYSRALLSAVPGSGLQPTRMVGEPLGSFAIPAGCRFHPRCPEAAAICARQVPALKVLADGRRVACHAAGA